MLKKNEIYRTAVSGFTSEGLGVCRVDGCAVFVPNAAPDEEYDLRITHVGRHAAYGRIERILTASPDRCTRLCPDAKRCGGCDFWHLRYPAECRIKAQRVTDALNRIGGQNLPLVALTTAAVTATITTSAQTASGLAPAVEQRIRMNTSSAVNANWTFRFGGPYYSHLFIDKIYAKSDPIIPCQSVFDVQIAARLGFKFIEANVHATATPGKYIVMHGVRGCLGDQVTDLDGNSAADVVIRQTPFDTLMSKYRYRSRYAKYRTHITSMEEFLLECRRNNIAPMISHVDEEQVRIIRSIMGENFILYWGTREEFSGPILEYHTYKSIRQIVDRCKYMGAPYLYCMGNVRDFTDEQLRTIAREVHNVGCYVGYAGCYEPPQNNQKLLDMGFDFSASGWDINEIDNGNLCNLTADLRFDDFRTDGTEREAVLCLDAGQSVAPGVELPSEFLSGGSLHVRFEGKIRVEMGDYIHTEFASDGERSMWWSSYFIEQAPTFRITAVEPTRIINMTYKASKM